MDGIKYDASEYARAILYSSQLVNNFDNYKSKILSILDLLASADLEMGIGADVENIRTQVEKLENEASEIASKVRAAQAKLESIDANVASQLSLEVNKELDNMKKSGLVTYGDFNYLQDIDLAKKAFNNPMAPYKVNKPVKDYGILNNAAELWSEVYNGNYTYDASVLKQVPVKGPIIDCSSYVSWVLYDKGYKDFKGTQYVTSDFVRKNFNEKYGWEEISVKDNEDVTSKLQPGDILVRDMNGNGHMNITAYVKDGKVYAYDCGGTDNWRSSNGEPVDKTKFAKYDPRPGKIIRISDSNLMSDNENDEKHS